MSEYKLLSFDPTPEMVSAAEDAYMPFGDMDLALRMAILAAPAVPVAWQLRTPEGRSEYRPPQLPAAWQPCPESIREGAPYDDPAFSALCREYEIWGTAAAAQCAVFWEAGKRAAEQQPGVAGLVWALKQILGWRELRSGREFPIERIEDIARAALAESRANDLTAMGYLNQIRQLVGGDDFPDMVERVEALQAENAQLRAAIRRLCNIYVVDDYYMGQLREERLDAAVNRAIEQVKETNHENQ